MFETITFSFAPSVTLATNKRIFSQCGTLRSHCVTKIPNSLDVPCNPVNA